MKNMWMGTKPNRCDLCSHRFNRKDKHFYDFATKQGPWALGCEKCFRLLGKGLGHGKGQQYDLSTLEKVEQAATPVTSLAELRMLARDDPTYGTYIELAASNIGGPRHGVDECYEWLLKNAAEVSEQAVVDEVNDCIALFSPDAKLNESEAGCQQQ